MNNAELVELPSDNEFVNFPNWLPDTFFHVRQNDDVDILFREISYGSAYTCVDALFLQTNYFAIWLDIKPEAETVFHRPTVFFFVIYMLREKCFS